jgi:serine phosphatase RsbU (regulator of sigma subunit)
VFTDGILEASANGKELGLQGVTALAKAVVHLPLEQALTKIMGLFQQARLQTTDDATLMIVGE